MTDVFNLKSEILPKDKIILQFSKWWSDEEIRQNIIPNIPEKNLKDSIDGALNNFNGIRVIDDYKNNKFPEAVDSAEQHDVLVGRIRNRYGDKTNTKYELFISGDQILKGCALNMLQICKLL